MRTLIDATLLGVLTGSVYALLSVGLALIFGVMRVVNFGHAELMMVAAYLVIGVVAVVHSVWIGVVVALAGVVALGYVVDRMVLQPLRAGAAADFELRSLVAMIGFALLLANGVFIIAGPEHLRTPGFVSGSVQLVGIAVPWQQVIAGLASLVSVAALLVFLQRTRLGMAIRAVRDQPDLVEAFGVRRDRIYATTFAIASGLAGLAGILIAPVEYVYPYMGSAFLLKAFVIVVMAGLGSLNGVLAAGVLLGVVESLSIVYLGGQAGALMFFGAMVLTLLVRPYGLLGTAEAR